MFFIFGTPRSGTTLLAQCLNAHRELVVPYETDFIIPMAFLFDRVTDPAVGRELISKLIVSSAAFGRSIGEHIGADDVRDAVYGSDYHPAAVLSAIYGKVAAAAGARLAGDKSPNDLFFIRMLLKTGGISPTMKILHIVRDIRDVMVSLNKTGWAPDLDLYFPRYWCAHNLYLNAIEGREPGRYLLVRYEDLVRDPAGELGKCCDMLGVTFEEEMLLPTNRHARYRAMPALTRVYEPIDATRIGVHRAELDAATRSSYETQAREALVAFGYLPRSQG